MKVLEMKEKIKRKTVKSSEKGDGKEVEETVAFTYTSHFFCCCCCSVCIYCFC